VKTRDLKFLSVKNILAKGNPIWGFTAFIFVVMEMTETEPKCSVFSFVITNRSFLRFLMTEELNRIFRSDRMPTLLTGIGSIGAAAKAINVVMRNASPW